MELLYAIFILPIELFYKYVYLACADITGSYGIGLFVLSIISALAFLPLAKMALVSQAKENTFQDIIRPQLAEINEKYSGSNKQAAITRLYKRYAYHPILGIRSAFGVLLQVPFLTGAYYMISALPQIKGQSFLFIHDLSLPDGLLFGINILPIIMTIINIGVVFTTKGLARKDIIQALVIAFFFLVLLYPAPSALLIFWTTNNLFFLIQNLLPARKAKKIKSLKKHGRMYNFLFSNVTAQDLRTYAAIYFLSLFALILMIFFYLPSEFYLSEPNFFGVNITTFLLGMLPYASMTALIIMLLWLWSNNSMKRFFAILAFFLLIFALVNKFILVRDFGQLMGGELSNHTKLLEATLLFRDFLASILVAFLIFCVFYWNKIKQYRLHFIVCVSLPLVILTLVPNFKEFTIERPISSYDKNKNTHNFTTEEVDGIHSYSKDGENVVILILDMFTGGHIEPMLNDPWFENFSKDLEGFVWYPDTTSTGSHTILSLPSIYAGHEYTPFHHNKSSGETIDERMLRTTYILPKKFAKHNYEIYPPRGYDGTDGLGVLYNPSLGSGSSSRPEALVKEKNDTKKQKKDTIANRPDTSINGFVLVVSLYQMSPSIIKRSIYLDNWLGTQNNFKHGERKLASASLNSLLFFLNSEKNSDNKRNTLKIMYSYLSHSLYFLGPESLNLRLNPPLTDTHVESYMRLHYYTERHMMKFIMDYIEDLKLLEIYDNTKIIIVSDHDDNDSQMLRRIFPNDKEVIKGRPHPLLMVKDFNSKGELKIDPSLMANADVPMLAMLGLPNCDEFTIIDPRGQNNRFRRYFEGPLRRAGEKFVIDYVYELNGTMFNLDNWKEYTYEDWLETQKTAQ